jgi:hypothetical protein
MRHQFRGEAALLLCVLLTPSITWGQILLFDMNDSSVWTTVGDPDTEAQFGFDYSPYGIPAGPNSSDTRGLRLSVNMTEPAAPAAISVSPTGLSMTSSYRMEVDVWLNYYADPENVGTTEFAGTFVGFDPTQGPINGAGLIGSSDADAAEDFRMFAGSVPHLPLTSGQYFVESLDHGDLAFQETFESAEIPLEQVDEFDPANEFVVTRPGALAFAWRTFSVEVDPLVGSALFAIDDLEIGFVETELNGVNLRGGVALTMWDLFSSVAPVGEFAFAIFDDLRIIAPDVMVLGDFNIDGMIDVADINLLSDAIRAGSSDLRFDVDGDGVVGMADHNAWVVQIQNTYLGDANLDGEFSSADFVATFQRGEYEDAMAGNSGWEDGDWNADGDFDSSDFVAAFQQGGYEQGPRGAVVAVPEPAGLTLLAGAAAFAVIGRRRG